MGERHPKKGRSLNAGQHQTIDLIEQLSRERNSVVERSRYAAKYQNLIHRQ